MGSAPPASRRVPLGPQPHRAKPGLQAIAARYRRDVKRLPPRPEGEEVYIPNTGHSPEGGSPLWEEEAIKEGESCKSQGNRLFSQGEPFKAYEAYAQGVDRFMNFSIESMSPLAKKLCVTLCTNAAQALLRCDDVPNANTELAHSMADRALLLEPENVKALFRRGAAYANAQCWSMARDDFERALELEPGNDAVRKELDKVQGQLASQQPTFKKVSKFAWEKEETVCPEIDFSDAFPEPLRAGAAAMVRADLGPERSKDPAEVARTAMTHADQFRAKILDIASNAGLYQQWCQKLNKLQVQTSSWARHQLEDAETVEDLLVIHGATFRAMDSGQREDFLTALDFVNEVRERHGDDIDRMAGHPVV